jgi:hypothetical protein
MNRAQTSRRTAVARGRHDPSRIEAAERRIAVVTRLLDDMVTVPGTRHRFGLDAVVGLIPGVGDLASAAIGVWVIAEAARFKLPPVVLARMVVNTVVDFVIGAIPILGDAFDFVFKSNSRNLELFRRHATDPGASTAGHRAFLAGLALLLVGAVWLLAIALGALLSITIPAP